MTQKSALATTLRRHRIQARLTTAELAKKAGVHVRTIRRIESGRIKTIPTMATICSLADALDIDPADLVLPDREGAA